MTVFQNMNIALQKISHLTLVFIPFNPICKCVLEWQTSWNALQTYVSYYDSFIFSLTKNVFIVNTITSCSLSNSITAYNQSLDCLI